MKIEQKLQVKQDKIEEKERIKLKRSLEDMFEKELEK